MPTEEKNEELHDFQAGYLALPIKKSQFEQFVKGLLGSPQTIMKKFDGTFEYNLSDLQSYHELVNQRVTQQNGGIFVELTTQIYYSDDSSVILSSYEQLTTYNEIKPVISIAVRMTWTYLIHFPDKEVPEKQEIELYIRSSSDDIPDIPRKSESSIMLYVRHTARTWGSDIESMISNQVESTTRNFKGFRKYIYNNSGQIGLLTGISFFGIALAGLLFSLKHFNKIQLQVVSNFTNNTATTDSKVNFLLKFIAENKQSVYFLSSLFYIITMVIMAIIFSVWVNNQAENRPRSFLILTREATAHATKQKKKMERKTLMFFVSILVSICTGLLSRFLFNFITGA